MVEGYRELKYKSQQEFNEFSEKYMFYAFNKKQFADGMKEFGLEISDTHKINQVAPGAFVRKEKVRALYDMSQIYADKIKEAMKDEEFAYDAFKTELANHEYCITYDASDALAVLGFNLEEIRDNEILSKAYLKARKDYLAEVEI